jgi:hypothetical protein
MNWRFAAALDVQSGQPIDVRLTRPDIVYVDASGRVFDTPAADRSAVINVPGGGSSLDVRRPDLIPGVNPYLDQDRNYLNPAAFAIPAPGTFGNLKRGQLRGVKTWYADLSIRKQVITAENNILEFRVDISNLFNFTNFDKPVARLTGVLGMDAAAGQLQPGQPFTTQAAGMAFGVLNRTVKRAQDFSASRQILFGVAFRFNGGTSSTDRTK